MKISIPTLAALLISAAAAAPAFAGPATSYGRADYAPDDMSWVGQSTASRAQVKAELVQARADGQLAQNANDINYPTPSPAPAAATVTRAQVKAELMTAQANGQLFNVRAN